VAGRTTEKCSLLPQRLDKQLKTRRRRTSSGTPDASRSSSRGQASGGGAPGVCPGPGAEPASHDGLQGLGLRAPMSPGALERPFPPVQAASGSEGLASSGEGLSAGSRERPSRAERRDVLAPVHQIRPTHGRLGSAPASEAANRGGHPTNTAVEDWICRQLAVAPELTEDRWVQVRCLIATRPRPGTDRSARPSSPQASRRPH
jgi:hypothetical protein